MFFPPSLSPIYHLQNALVVSNDCFRDHCSRDKSLRPFVQHNRVSYTFFNQEFMPNPAHPWVKKLNERLRAREGGGMEGAGAGGGGGGRWEG
jgi:hypothetical protein